MRNRGKAETTSGPALLELWIEKYGVKKSVIASSLGLHRMHVYAYLYPAKYKNFCLSDENRELLDQYVRANVRNVA